MEHLIEIIGCIILWFATDIGRDKNTQIKLFSRDFWYIIIIMAVGITLIKSANLI